MPAMHEDAPSAGRALLASEPEAPRRPARTFVPVDELVAAGVAGSKRPVAPPIAARPPAEARPAPGWSLWGDLDP